MQKFNEYLQSNGFTQKQINSIILELYNNTNEDFTTFSIDTNVKCVIKGAEWKRMTNQPINSIVIKSNHRTIDNEIFYCVKDNKIEEVSAKYFDDIKQDYLQCIEWIDRCVSMGSYYFNTRKEELVKFLIDGAKGETNDTAVHEYRWDPIPVWALKRDDENRTTSELSLVKQLLESLSNNIHEWRQELHQREPYEYEGTFSWRVGDKIVNYLVYVDEGNTEYSWSYFVRESIEDYDDDDDDEDYDDEDDDDDEDYDDEDDEEGYDDEDGEDDNNE